MGTPQHRMVAIDQIKSNPRNARTHSKKQISQISNSIGVFGFTVPILIDEHGMLLAGEGRLHAARHRNFRTIPAVVIEGLSEAKKRALLLADNKIPQNAGWDRERLASELASLPELLVEDDLNITITGFDPAEIDALVADFEEDGSDPADDVDPAHIKGPAVTVRNDLYQLGNHRFCAVMHEMSLT